jgi:hypothetical protein
MTALNPRMPARGQYLLEDGVCKKIVSSRS